MSAVDGIRIHNLWSIDKHLTAEPRTLFKSPQLGYKDNKQTFKLAILLAIDNLTYFVHWQYTISPTLFTDDR